ncbi:MAG: pentapeptide repeat-containing protein [Bacteroidetes bacterium]|nr:pentapeptide repeat-containing protein [Bacteroidota bacterium]
MTTSEKLHSLKSALDQSSSTNRNLGLAFTAFLVYVLIIVAGTTDFQLLVPDIGIELPLIGIELPLLGFYFFTPLLILFLHYNLLLNLSIHADKLQSWLNEILKEKDASQKREPQELIRLIQHPFLFNFLWSMRPGSTRRLILLLVIEVFTFILPLMILVYIQIRFSDYHSKWMTAWHFVIMMADSTLLDLFKKRIISSNLSDYGTLFGFKNNKEGKKLPRIFTQEFNKLFFLYLNKSKDFFGRIFIGKNPIFLRRLLVLASYLNFLIILWITSIWAPNKCPLWRVVVPHLDLQEKSLVAKSPDPEIISAYIQQGMDKNEALVKYSSGLSLKNRDLRYGLFYKSNLVNVDLRCAYLQGTDFQYAQMQGANLSSSIFWGAELDNCLLQNSNLTQTQFQTVDLSQANLSGANLTLTKLQGANLYSTQFKGAYFNQAKLQGANLFSAELQAASILRVGMQGATLLKADLGGANVIGSHFQGVSLKSANLQGTYFINTQLKGIDTTNWKAKQAIFIDPKFETINFDSMINLYSIRYPRVKNPHFENYMRRGAAFCDTIKDIDFSTILIDEVRFIKARMDLVCNETVESQEILNWLKIPEATPYLEQLDQKLIDSIRVICPLILKGIDVNKPPDFDSYILKSCPI